MHLRTRYDASFYHLDLNHYDYIQQVLVLTQVKYRGRTGHISPSRNSGLHWGDALHKADSNVLVKIAQ